jgi:GT2 family glycosyltransferase
VILLDNGSRDDSLECLRSYSAGNLSVSSKFFEYTARNNQINILEYSNKELIFREHDALEIADLPSNKKLILIKNDKNYGFAEGNNIGIRFALEFLEPNYILLLNNDTVVDKNFITELVAIAKIDKQIGFAGPKVYFYDLDGRDDVINVAGSRLDMHRGRPIRIGAGEVDTGQHDCIEEMDYVEGSCMLASSEVLMKIGLLNSRYFAYWEETDLCRRGAEAGYKSVYVPKSKIWHKIGSSSNSSFRLYHMTRNRLWFMRAHAKGKDLLIFLLYFFGYAFWLTCGVYLRRKDTKSLTAFMKGVLDGVIDRGR